MAKIDSSGDPSSIPADAKSFFCMRYNEFAKMCDFDSSRYVTGTYMPSTGSKL